MSEFLSQDDINALLEGGFGGDDDSSGAVSEDTDFLKDASSDFSEQVEAALKPLTSRDVMVAPSDKFVGDEDMVISHLGDEEYLIIPMPISGDVEGTLTITILKTKAAILYDLMLLGDGSSPYSDEVIDGISEMFSSVSSGYCSFLREKTSASASSEGIAVKDNDGVSILISEECQVLDIAITDVDPFPVIISYDDPLVASLRPHYVTTVEPSGGVDFDDDNLLSQDEIDSITAAADDIAAVTASAPAPMAAPAAAPGFTSAHAPQGSVDMLLDIDLDVSIELGRTDISIKRVLELAPGALVELDRLAGEPVDLLVNNKVVAKGEVVVVDESFGVRIISLVSPEERIKSLR